ncbi:hypothetical protein BU197_25965 [Streptomyces sp. CBMA291]|nr:hypothetical protein [Streptomyces sp. CBMA291]MBD0713913.1 hypothetical protein [Streptomyces sp. CBMA370]
MFTAGLLASGSVATPSPARAAEPPATSQDSAPGQGAPLGRDSAPGQDSAPVPGGAMGAFLGSDDPGVSRIGELQRWLGGRELRVAHTYLPGDLWQNIEGSPRFLAAWTRWREEKPDRVFVLNVPMLERNEDGLSDAEVRRELRTGAAGAYDHHFGTLARRLVALRAPDTIVVLGWEMNGSTYSHRCAPDPAAWRAYWSRIVTVMRSVPGQRFRFDFAPARGLDAVPWTACYPGDDVVDVIGMDSYDQPRGSTFAQHVTEPYGLKAQVDFAAAHGKRISYPEWGLFRNGDNQEYLRSMLEWMKLHRPLYQTISDYCPHGVWRCEDNPKSSALYRRMLYGTGPTLPAEPGPGPGTAPAPESWPEPDPVPETGPGTGPGQGTGPQPGVQPGSGTGTGSGAGAGAGAGSGAGDVVGCLDTGLGAWGLVDGPVCVSGGFLRGSLHVPWRF